MSEKSSSNRWSSENTGFGLDEMPTITTLLNRRKLRLDSEASEQSPEKQEKAEHRVKITPRTNERRESVRLELWTPELLATASTRELQAISLLLTEKCSWVLMFLKNEEDDLFDARAVTGGNRQLWALWTGVRWGQMTSPAVWNEFQQKDYLEFSPKNFQHSSLLTALGCPTGQLAWAFWIGGRERPLAILLAGGTPSPLSSEVLKNVVELLV